MTRIDFYTQVGEPDVFACRLAQTVYNRGERLLVRLADDRALEAFSTRLWSFDDVAFVPHCRSDAREAVDTPVWLTSGQPGDHHPSVLLNLSSAMLDEPERYARILEVVGVDDASLALARTRFKLYRERGFAIEHHDMSNR